MSSEQPPGTPGRDDDPMRPPPRPVAPPGQVATPDQLPTVEPGEWPAQPSRARVAAPPSPPPQQAPQQPAPPPYSPGPPAPPRRSLAWLWLTLAAVVVLVVGAATTLVVVRPWQDDASDRDVSAEPRRSDAAPSPPQSSDPPASPAPEAPVTSDLDGDGYGDARVLLGAPAGIQRWELSSTGHSFEVARGSAASFEDQTWADFDGDGELEAISWDFEYGGTLTLTSDDAALGDISLRVPLDERQPFITLKAGDVDGDRLVDLVGYGATGPDQVSVWVIRNNGEGFDAPVEWGLLSHTTYRLTKLLAADFTGDGRTDVVVRTPLDRRRDRDGRSGTRFGYTLLTSTGTAFVPGGTVHPDRFVDVADAVVGDFAGDGTPLLLLLGPGRRGVEVRALRVSGTRFRAEPSWARWVGGESSRVVDAVVADVDGDHLDDVVYTAASPDGQAFDGVRVLRSTGAGVGRSEVWAPTPRCPSRRCVLYFQNSD